MISVSQGSMMTAYSLIASQLPLFLLRLGITTSRWVRCDGHTLKSQYLFVSRMVQSVSISMFAC